MVVLVTASGSLCLLTSNVLSKTVTTAGVDASNMLMTLNSLGVSWPAAAKEGVTSSSVRLPAWVLGKSNQADADSTCRRDRVTAGSWALHCTRPRRRWQQVVVVVGAADEQVRI